jgi:hypothetical protein
VAIVAEEARVFVRVPHVVREEIEPVRHGLPVGHDRRDVIVDGDVRILVDRRTDLAQVPTGLVVEVEERQVERFG